MIKNKLLKLYLLITYTGQKVGGHSDVVWGHTFFLSLLISWFLLGVVGGILVLLKLPIKLSLLLVAVFMYVCQKKVQTFLQKTIDFNELEKRYILLSKPTKVLYFVLSLIMCLSIMFIFILGVKFVLLFV